MPDVEKILRMVAEGAISAEEAEQILAMLDEQERAGARPADRTRAADGPARHLRIEVTEGGRRMLNLRVPMNVAGMVAGLVPGLPQEEAERIRTSIRSGRRGPIVDVGDQDGDRVLIVSE